MPAIVSELVEGGVGLAIDNICTECNGAGTTFSECRVCYGTGERGMECKDCGGAGVVLVDIPNDTTEIKEIDR